LFAGAPIGYRLIAPAAAAAGSILSSACARRELRSGVASAKLERNPGRQHFIEEFSSAKISLRAASLSGGWEQRESPMDLNGFDTQLYDHLRRLVLNNELSQDTPAYDIAMQVVKRGYLSLPRMQRFIYQEEVVNRLRERGLTAGRDRG
jgi:hypothetical protein